MSHGQQHRDQRQRGDHHVQQHGRWRQRHDLPHHVRVLLYNEFLTIDCLALGAALSIEANEVAVADGYLRRVYGMVAGPAREKNRTAISLRRSADGAFIVGSGTVAPSYEGSDVAEALEVLVRAANQVVLSSADPRLLLLHGAAVQSGSHTVVLPAASEAGKSTLTAGLVAAGWAYGTDDIVAIDPATDLVHPYPRPICLDPGSHALFAEVKPEIDPEWESMLTRQWHLTVDDLAPAGPGVARPQPVTHIVFPRYEAGAETRLTPLPRPRALLELLQLQLRAADSEQSTFETLAPIVASARCHRLIVGELHEAVSELDEMIAGEQTPPGRAQLLDVPTIESTRSESHLLTDVPRPDGAGRFGRGEKTQTVDLDGQLLIHHRGSGVTHELNAVAAEIWMSLDAERSLSDVAAALSAHYGQDVLHDVLDLAHTLASQGFIRPVDGALT